MVTTPNSMPQTHHRGTAPSAPHVAAPAPSMRQPITGNTQPIHITPLAAPAPARAPATYHPQPAAPVARPTYVAPPVAQSRPMYQPPMQSRPAHVTNVYPQTTVYQQVQPRQPSFMSSVGTGLLTGLGIGVGARLIGSMMSGNRPMHHHTPAPSYAGGYSSSSMGMNSAMHPEKFNRLLNAAISQRNTWMDYRTGREVSIPTGDIQAFKKEVHDILDRNGIQHDPNAFFNRNILDRAYMSSYERRQAPVGHRIGSQLQDYSEHMGQYTIGAGGHIRANHLSQVVLENQALLQRENSRDYSQGGYAAQSRSPSYGTQYAYASPPPQRQVAHIRFW